MFKEPAADAPSAARAPAIPAVFVGRAFKECRVMVPSLLDLIAGRVDFSLAFFNSARSNMDAKKLRALAVDAETRLPALPDIPTLIEAGLGAHRVADWAGVLAPAGTPTAIVDRLNREFVKAAHTPELIAKLTENGNIVASSTPQEMSRLVADEVKNMEQLIKALGLKAQ